MANAPLPPELVQAIDARAGAVRSQRFAWEQAAARAWRLSGDPGAVARLIAAFPSARGLDALTRQANRAGEPLGGFLEGLKQQVDESEFGFADWLAALERVLIYLERESRYSKPSTIAGYVHCCEEAAAASRAPRPELVQVVEGMLGQYGFDG